MKHLPYEGWLLSEEELTVEEERTLRMHLDSCAACSRLATALQAVEQEFTTIPLVAPAPGFGQRWQAALVEKTREAQIKRQRSLTWMFFALSALGALTIFVVLNLQFFSNLPTPVEFVTQAVYQMSLAISVGKSVLNLASVIREVLPLSIPLVVWIDITTAFCILCFVWIFAIWRLPISKRSTTK
ncbi:MAG: hypothetical protein M1281_18190 [Chloroflexi bacterium]|nr:hypothetical protein [Chloroflexota bacterium]